MIGLANVLRLMPAVSVTLSLWCAIGPAAAEQRIIASVGNWRAMEATQGAQRYCFVIAAPSQRMPPDLKRGPGAFFVSRRPKSAGGGTEASIEFGYPVISEGNVAMVDGERFLLVTRNETGWLEREADEVRLLNALRRGRDLRVTAQSRRGNRTTDIYGLRGFSGALDELQKKCRP